MSILIWALAGYLLGLTVGGYAKGRSSKLRTSFERITGIWVGTLARIPADHRLAWIRRTPLLISPLSWNTDTGHFWRDWLTNWRGARGVQVTAFGWSVYVHAALVGEKWLDLKRRIAVEAFVARCMLENRLDELVAEVRGGRDQ